MNKPLNKILNSESKVKILRLFCSAGGETSGRQIAKLLKASSTAVQAALRDLYNEGVLERKAFGRAYAYSFNSRNEVVAKVLKPMFEAEACHQKDFWDNMNQRIESSPVKIELLSVVLFGSVFKGQERPTSDIDLLVVIKNDQAKPAVEDLFFEMNRDTIQRVGLSIDAHIYSIDEFHKKVTEGLAFIKAAIRSNKVVWGERLEVII